ncbi:hypothetical protein M8C21_018272 [Ambrosia artemisiifolia]|uniref:Uncharacterized protein n=1 Tax=Ambrosia artemisiifolia TaxID=4212 RepID=A0AAD5CET5_AMBAR|nr:hypothetical protein M8C21_018272 [Ambrosia artemisiifolia]
MDVQPNPFKYPSVSPCFVFSLGWFSSRHMLELGLTAIRANLVYYCGDNWQASGDEDNGFVATFSSNVTACILEGTLAPSSPSAPSTVSGGAHRSPSQIPPLPFFSIVSSSPPTREKPKPHNRGTAQLRVVSGDYGVSEQRPTRMLADQPINPLGDYGFRSRIQRRLVWKEEDG